MGSVGEDVRRQLHAYLSDDAHAGWADFAARHGTSATALVEALGIALARQVSVKRKSLDPFLRDVVAEARTVASERSRRPARTAG